jgi:sigma-54 dependent transcriptional regulator, acetoin dehydrogenase operon transcriptional activator AcoR
MIGQNKRPEEAARGDTMSVTGDRQTAHARAIQARSSALPPEGLPSTDILDSWSRCLQAGLDCAASRAIVVVEAAELARRRERAEVTRRLAQAELETLSQQIAGSNFLLAFADRDGVILDLYCDNRFTMSGPDAGIRAGSCWAESLCGTNGLGTALATGHSMSVTGLEHYFLALREVSCTATPVRDALGDIVGVLDASSYFESRQRHTQALVQMAATHIENGLLIHQMRTRCVLAIHPRPEFLRTLSAGLLAFDDDGRLVASNARGRQLLQGLNSAPGTPFEALFDDAFEALLSRLRGAATVPLRDVLGSALVATCVSAPTRLQPPSPFSRPPAIQAIAPPMAARGPQRALPPSLLPPLPPGSAADDPQVAQAYRLVEAAVRLSPPGRPKGEVRSAQHEGTSVSPPGRHGLEGAPVRVPILIQGETGSGKEMLARYAHQSSGRTGAFVAVNCGALPSELFEAELFGYVGGAFTGARRGGSTGLITSADGGTLLLDEISELPLPLQAALLRFMDDQAVRPVGGTSARRVDVQLLAATNARLDDEVAARRFRADLLYRLNTVCVELPPLRRRRDFTAAAHHVLAALDVDACIADDALARLARHTWPGNFRELRSVLTRALLTCSGRHLALADIDALLPPVRPTAGSHAAGASALQLSATELVCREFERTGRSVSRTSRNLGISRTTVYRHLRDLGVARR